MKTHLFVVQVVGSRTCQPAWSRDHSFRQAKVDNMAASHPTQVCRGIVKQVLSGDAVIVRGQPKGGPPPERQINFSNVIAPRQARRATANAPETVDEPYAWESREFLRKKVIGKEVLFTVETKTSTGREYGAIYVGKDISSAENITETMVSEGSGRWAGGDAQHVRNIKWTCDNMRSFVDKARGKPIDAVIEHVRDGSTVRCLLLPDFNYITLMISGIRCPMNKLDSEGKPDKTSSEPFADEARYYTESRLLQRDVQVILETFNNNNFVGSIIHPNGNIAEALLREGFARCVDWSIASVTGGPEKLRAAEKLAKEKKLRLWTDYKPSGPKIADKDREFTGKVIEVVNGDALVVKRQDGSTKKIFLASIRPPRLPESEGPRAPGKNFRPLYDIPWLFETREFLRKKLIGQKVQITVDFIQPAQNNYPEKTCCTVKIGDINVAEAMVSKGLATVVRYRQDDDQRASCYDDLLSAEAKAIKTNKGLHNKKETPIHRIADISGDVSKAKSFLPFLQRAGRTEAVVEFVASGSRFRLFIPRETCLITFLLAGISCPRGSRPAPGGGTLPGEPFGEEALNLSKSLIMQREVEIEVDSMDKGGNYIGWLHVDKKNLSVHLVEEGLSSVHVTAESSKFYHVLSSAQTAAKQKKLNIWANYVEEEKEEKIADKDREFTGKVIEVVNGDALVVKRQDGSTKKIFLASIRPPRLPESEGPRAPGKNFRPLYDIPWLFETREFLRKKLIGQKVQITVDFIQPAQNNYPEKTCCTVKIGDINVAEAMVSKGLATVVRYRQDDDQRASCYDDLLSAEAKAIKTNKGLHNKKETPIHRIADISGDVSKAKSFLPFLQRAGRTEAVVEFVASGSRFRLFIPRETCLITFLLAGISCPRGSRPAPGGGTLPGEPFGEEALNLSKSLIMQREVEIEVDSMDKGGNYIGWLHVDKKNLSVHLVEEGLSSVHVTAESSKFYHVLSSAQTAAKQKKLNIWANYVEEEKEEKVEELQHDRVLDYKPVMITEVSRDGTLFAQYCSDGPALEQLMEKLRQEFTKNPPLAGAYTPKRNELCAAQFIDGSWYRAKVEKVAAGKVSVRYIDYGNREDTQSVKCAALPMGFHSAPGYAHEFHLALVKFCKDEDFLEDALAAFMNEVMDREVLINREYRLSGAEYVSIQRSDTKVDVAKTLISQGLLMLDERKDKRLQSVVSEYRTAQEEAKRKHLNIWQYGDITDDDAHEFGMER
ncbi:nuclease domain-containing protein 1 [Penaeus vannamei]|uniref:Staphylococcal nuclease domain-containing protein 1 n=1 Tax=Penaeus vannamei TaxID=6689 RepID=A0A423TAD8_PENVA|nr:nuclease domain-containing protein 1 [Penaeus vannamei]